jgi:HD-GYP domain-containing protein (c-di-GMP phosphodiesterase class II)
LAIEERSLPLDALQPGMFVCRIDRPWGETPFPLQGLMITSRADIDSLRPFTLQAVVDFRRSVLPQGRSLLLTLGYRPTAGARLPELRPYPDALPVEHELPRARSAHRSALGLAQRLQEDLRAGRPLELDQLSEAVEPMVASVLRSPDAFFWLMALRQRDPYAYAHALNDSALVVALGRQIGLPAELLVEIAGAALLMDIGMSLLPDGLCNHGLLLSPLERRQVQRHVELGMQALRERSGVSDAQIEWIASHHERHDGSGYPHGLAGNEIPLFSRMLGLVDTFDALCTDRPHQKGQSRHDATQYLYRERDSLFQAELVEQFGQALGVYPTGTLIELSSGEVAVVTQQNAARRLFPRVTVLTHPDKSINPAFPQVDLWLDEALDGGRRTILRGLRPGAHGIDLAQLFLSDVPVEAPG